MCKKKKFLSVISDLKGTHPNKNIKFLTLNIIILQITAKYNTVLSTHWY